jgi:hypothetical protein
MMADFFMEPLVQGKLFHYLKAIIMGHKPLAKVLDRDT